MGGVFRAEDAAPAEVPRQDSEGRSWGLGQEAAARVRVDAEPWPPAARPRESPPPPTASLRVNARVPSAARGVRRHLPGPSPPSPPASLPLAPSAPATRRAGPAPGPWHLPLCSEHRDATLPPPSLSPHC